MTDKRPLIEFRDVHKSFGQKVVLDGVNLKVLPGEVTTIIGKSGVGKSVLLKHVIWLVAQDSGDILYDGVSYRNLSRKDRKAIKARVSYMFQNNALFDSMTVFENLALPLKEKRQLADAEIKKRVMEKMESLEIGDVPEKYPSQLSGGMQKRCALARALITDPEIVLFDEPTTGLDPLRKNAVLSMIAHYQRQYGFTAVLVSHDIPDVFYISNRIAILEAGKTLFEGTPLELEQSSQEMVNEFMNSLESLKNDLLGLDSRARLETRFKEMSDNPVLGNHFSVLIFTISDFDRIKDEVGHLAAQYVMEAVVGIIRKYFGGVGFSGRYSPEVIMTVLPRVDETAVNEALANLAREMENLDVMRGTHYPRVCVDFNFEAGMAQGRPGMRLESMAENAMAARKPIARLSCGSSGQRT